MLQAADELIDIRVFDVRIQAAVAEALLRDFLEHAWSHDARHDLHRAVGVVGQQHRLCKRRIGIPAVVCAHHGLMTGPHIPRNAEPRREGSRRQRVAPRCRRPAKPIDAQSRQERHP